LRIEGATIRRGTFLINGESRRKSCAGAGVYSVGTGRKLKFDLDHSIPGRNRTENMDGNYKI
jgi:hypothetical protein